MRTTISLPDTLAQLARREARRRGVSLSAVVRESLEASLHKPAGARLPWQGIVRDPKTTARALEAALRESWPDYVAGDR